jgi:hypothetical protein
MFAPRQKPMVAVGPQSAALAPQPQQAAPAPEQDARELPPYVDVAKHILLRAGMVHGLDDEETAAQIWDDFYSTRTSAEFARKLSAVNITPELRHELFVAHETYRYVSPARKSKVDKVIEAMHRMGSKFLPMAHVETGEKHPHVMKALTDSVLKQRDREQE